MTRKPINLFDRIQQGGSKTIAFCRIIPNPQINLRVPIGTESLNPEFRVKVLENGSATVSVTFGHEEGDDIQELTVEFEEVIDISDLSNLPVLLPAGSLLGDQGEIVKLILSEVCTISFEWDGVGRDLFMMLKSDVLRVHMEVTLSDLPDWEKFIEVVDPSLVEEL